LKKEKPILFLIYTPLINSGGHSKNFIHLIKNISANIKFNKKHAIIISLNNNKNNIKSIKNNINLTDYFSIFKIYYFLRLFPSNNLVFQIFEYFTNFIRIFWIIILKRPKVIYCYADIPLFLTIVFKKIFNFKLIYDMRGDIINEWEVQGRNKNKIILLKNIHKFSLTQTNLIFSVSSTYPLQENLNIVSKYNYYDGDIFNFNIKEMIMKKKKLGLQNKFVFVYNGSSNYYQMIDETIKFFSQFHTLYSNSFFIIISESPPNDFRIKLIKFNIPNSAFMIKCLPQKEISKIQSIADMAFFLRDDLPLNHHAFPTKYAEYLASGIPVLTTNHLHSISPLVKKNHLGEVIQLQDDYSEMIHLIYNKYSNNISQKVRCCNYAQNNLMWQKKSQDVFNLIMEQYHAI